MKQTIKEAAREAIHKHYNCNETYPCSEREYCEHCNGHNTTFDCCECGADEFKEGFITGAEWQTKQSPWISVKGRLPEEGQKVFVLVMCYGTPCIREEKFCRNSNLDKKGMWIHGNSIVLAWFPIPSFDEILEANKDVLERIKEKGD